MQIDVSTLSYAQLAELAKQIQAQTDRIKSEALGSLVQEVLDLCNARQLPPAALYDALGAKLGVPPSKAPKAPTGASKAPGKGPKGSRASVAPKYRNPAGLETWSGRGIKPKWVQAHIDGGGSLSDLLISKT